MKMFHLERNALGQKIVRAAGTLATFVALACAALPASAQILGNGYAVVACRPTSGSPATLAIKDVTQFGTLWQTPANQGPTIDWSSNMPAGMEFTTADFGGHEVFSTTISSTGDIYTVTTTLYNIGHGAVVPVTVYKIDGMTGVVSPIVTVPGDRGGAYIEIDEDHNQLFVTNMDTGQIDRIDLATNTHIDSFDPLAADNGAAGMPPVGERLMGLTYNPNDGRVYYSVWATDGTATGNNNTIRSVALDGVGGFVAGSDQLEFTVPFRSGGTSMPVGDIEMNKAGTNMLLAEVGYNSSSNSSAPHQARVLEVSGSAGGWGLVGGTGKYGVGAIGNPGTNARGGIDWAYESIVAPTGGIVNDEAFTLITADAIRLNQPPPSNIYGFQFTPTTGGNINNSIVADVDYDTASQDKSVYGDVDVYRIYDVPLGYDLALIKTLSAGQPSGVQVGDNASFTIQVVNQADAESLAFTVTDMIPAGLSYVSATGTNFSCSASGQLVTCDYTGSLQPGDIATFDLVVSVDDMSQAPFRNWAEIESDSGDDMDSQPGDNDGNDTGAGDGGNGNDPVDNHNDLNHSGDNNDPLTDEDDSDYEDLFEETYDLALIKTRVYGSGAVSVGSSVYFEVEILNQGNVPAAAFSFLENIPDGLSLNYVYPSPYTCQDSGGTPLLYTLTPAIPGADSVTCTYNGSGPLAPGSTAMVRFRFAVTDLSTQPMRNWAEIETDDGDDTDSVPGDNDASDDGAGTGTPGNDPVINHNDIDHDDPAYDENTEDEDDSDYEDVGGTFYDLALIKELSTGQSPNVSVGSTVNYTITIKNQGNQNAVNYSITDMIPSGMSFVTATPSPDGTPPAGTTGLLTWTMGTTLFPNNTTTINLQLKVDDATQAAYRNWAEIETDNGTDIDSTTGSNDGNDAGPGDGGTGSDLVTNHNNIDNDSASPDKFDEDDSDYEDVFLTPPVETYDLALIKELAAGQTTSVNPGANVNYTITVKNQGTAVSGAYSVTDMIPAGMSYVSSTPAADGPPAAGATGLLTWTFPATSELAAGAVQTIALTLKVDDHTQAAFRNWAEIETDSGTDEDSQPGDNDGNDSGAGTGGNGNDPVDNHNNVDTDEPAGDEDDSDYEDVTVNVDYDLALIKELAAGQTTPVTPGSSVNYTVTVKNQGNVPSGAYSVTDMIPAGMSYVSSTPAADGPPAAGATGLLTWTFPATSELAAGAVQTIALTLKIDDVTQAPFRNWAEIETDSGADNDSQPGDNDGNDSGSGDGGNGNDDVDNHNDINEDEPAGDEDDSDYEDVDVTIDYDLALIKELAAGQATPVTPGSSVNYTVTVKNQGNVPSGAYSVTDMIPAGMSYVSSSPVADGAPAAGTTGLLTWSFPATSELAVGAVQTIALTLKIDDVTQAPFRNWAEIETDSGADNDSQPGDNDGNDSGSGNGGDGNDDVDNHNNVNTDEPAGDEDDSDYEDVDVTIDYDLALIKELDPTQAQPALPGGNVSYVITVQNQGNVPSGAYSVTDMLPAGMSYVSSTPAADGPPAAGATGLLTWTFPATSELGVGAAQTIALTVKIDDVTQAPFRNWAEIETDSGDDNDSQPGDNDGNDSGSGDGGNGNDPVDNHNDETIDEPTGDEDDSDYEDIDVNVDYDLALIKELAAGQTTPVTPGSSVNYTLTVKNQGNVPSGAYSITDMIPAGMSYVSSSPVADGAPAAGTTGLLTWSFAATSELAPGAVQTIALTLKIDDVTQAPFRNWAEIETDSGDDDDSQPGDNDGNDSGSGDGGNGNDDVDNHNNVNTDDPAGDEDDSDYEDVDVTVEYDLALIKELDPGQVQPALPGGNVSYVITVKNQGNVTSGAYSVSDMIPAGMSYVSSTPAADGPPAAGATGLLTWTFPSSSELAPNGVQTIALVLKIDDVTQAPFRNWAEIETDSGDDNDSQPGDNDGNDSGPGDGGNGNDDVSNHNDEDIDEPAGDEDDSDYEDIDVNVDYDLALIKELATGQTTPVAPGSNVSYTVTVKNQGNVPSGAYSVTDMIPAGMRYVSSTPAADGPPAAGATGLLTWSFPATSELAAGAVQTIALTLKIDDVTQAPFRNWAEIETDSGTDSDSQPGDNDGDDSGSGDGGNGNDDVDNHNDINEDEPAGDEDDSDYEDVDVSVEYDLALIKELDPAQAQPALPGGNVSYVITVQNQGNVPSGAYSVTDMLPAGMSYVSSTPAADGPPAAGATGLLTWTFPATSELAVGGAQTIQLTVTIDDVAQAPFRNWAEIETDSGTDNDSEPGDNDGNDSGTGDGGNGNDPVDNHNDETIDEPVGDEDDSDYEDIDVSVDYDLALIKELAAGQATPVTPGSTVSYTITVKNQGNVPSGAYSVTDMIPAGMSYVSSTPTADGAPSAGATGLMTWTFLSTSELAAGAVQTIELTVMVDDVTQAPFRNWAEIETDSGDDNDSQPGDNDGNDSGSGDGGNGNDDVDNHNNVNTDDPAGDEDDSDYEDIDVTVDYDLALIKELDPAQPQPAVPGGNVTYVLSVKNQGNVPSGAYSIADMIPAGMSYVSSSPAADGPPAAGATGLVTWSFPATGELAAGAVQTITLTVKIDDVTQAPFRNWAEIETDSGDDNDSQPGDNDGNDAGPGDGGNGSDDVDNHNNVDTDEPAGDEDDSDYEDIDVDVHYDLALIKTLATGQSTSVTSGSNVNYTVTVKNQGNVPTGAYSVTDMIPGGMSYVSSTPAADGPPAAGATGLLTWTVPATAELAPGAVATFDLTLKVDDITMAPFRNWAEIETDSGDDEDSQPGDNDGNDSGTGDGGNGNDPVDNHDDVNEDEPVGDEDDSDYADVGGTSEYDLALIKELDPAQVTPVVAGGSVNYVVTVKNQGDVPSGAFQVVDQIPAGMTFVSATGTNFTCVHDGAADAGLVTCDYTASLAPGATTTFNLIVTVADVTMSPFRNWAEIESDSGDDNDSEPGDNDGNDSGTGDGGTGNDDVDDHNDIDEDEPVGDEDDSDYADISADSNYDLALTKDLAGGTPPTVSPGSVVGYNIVVTNQGDVTSGAFSVADMIPAGMSFVSATPAPDGAPVAGTTGLLTWSIPATSELAVGGVLNITLNLQVDDLTQAQFRNWAEIETDSGDDSDSDPGDNDGNDDGPGDGGPGNDPETEDDSDYADLDLRYDLALVKTLATGQPAWINNGDTVSFDITVKNQGNVPSGDFTVDDSIPAGMQWIPLASHGTNVSCVHDGSPTSGVATCTYTAPSGADLAPNATVTISIDLLVLDVSQAPFANWAEITGDSSGDFGVTDADSQPNDNNAQDTGPGDTSSAGDPFEDQTDIEDDPNTPATEEDDSDPAYVFSASSTPITLESFLVDMQPGGSMAVFNWTTSMEDGNVGFNLYGRSSGQSWQKLNDQLIPATATSSDGAQYSAAQFGVTATEFAITDVDLFGKETVHGPFEPNRVYGLDQNDPEEGVVESIGGSDEADEEETIVDAVSGSVYLKVKTAGIQRVTYESLLAAGHDFDGVNLSNMAITYKGEAVPASVKGQDTFNPFGLNKFGPGAYVEFIADEGERKFNGFDIYKLSVTNDAVVRIEDENDSTAAGTTPHFIDTVTWEEDKVYSRVAPSDDPWYARKLLSLTSTAVEKVNIDAPGAVSNAAGAITVNVWGGHDDLSVLKENRVKVLVNGVAVIDTDIGGLQVHVLEGQIPAGTLVDGSNQVKIKVQRANGSNMALVNLDSIEIDYARQFRADNGALTLDSDATGFTVAGVNDPIVYRRDANGVARILTNSANGSVSFAGTGAMAEYFVADVAAIQTPKVKDVPAIGDMTSGPAEYLVITHRKFRGGALERLEMARQADGLTTKVVDVDWIYDVYAGGNVSTDAIREYIAFAAEELDTRYVVLVGGDTYDYKNILGKKAKSFIPTLYAQTTEAVTHAPVDPLYGDVDDDGIPDLAVGRLPVQNKIELRNLVNKTLEYAQATYGSTAIMAADDIDDSSQADFGALTDTMVDELPGTWKRKKAYLGKLSRDNARKKVVNNINKGVALTTWMGHSDLKIWGFDRLLRNKDINALNNAGKPTVVTQYGCWNTYYVDPSTKSMAHTWLNAKNGGGAAVVTGASTLTQVASEQALAVIVTRLLTTTDMTIGEAILAAKQQMASEQPLDAIRDVISGYIILGDPAVRIAK